MSIIGLLVIFAILLLFAWDVYLYYRPSKPPETEVDSDKKVRT